MDIAIELMPKFVKLVNGIWKDNKEAKKIKVITECNISTLKSLRNFWDNKKPLLPIK